MEPTNVLLPDDLLRRLAADDESAFRILYDRYGSVVYKTALRYLRTPDQASDIVQEVFCSLWDKRSQFSTVRNLESYLVVMTHHQVYAQFRKWATETKSREIYADNLEYAVSDTDFSLRTDQYEEILTRLVDKLPPQQKQVYKLAREEGMTHEAIAKQLNLSQGTVKNHMVRALKFLRQNLAPYIGSFLLLLTKLTGAS